MIKTFIAFLLLFLLPINANAVRQIETYQGLPNYLENSPFSVIDPIKISEIGSSLSKIVPSKHHCKAGSVLVWKAPVAGEDAGKDWKVGLFTNICNRNEYKKIKRLISSFAPSLNQENMTVWIINLGENKEPVLLIEYIDISKDELKYPYLSLWRLKLEKNSYEANYAGPFLNGSLHAVEYFGTKPGRKTVFIKHVSCIECEPIVYLTAIDFDAGIDAPAYEFSYSEKHDGFDPTIEYELPGMGHTVDAKVETRVLPPSTSGPHLLQFFKMSAGPNEWWVFTCKDYRCDYEMYKNKPPDSLKKLWKKAKRI